MKNVDSFLHYLKKINTKPLGYSTNLYKGQSKLTIIRRSNLTIYLNAMKKLNPDVLLLGEAPGYKGCALTGVPFTSEFIINENSFFDSSDYQLLKTKNPINKENSATIVWQELNKLERLPLIWNIYPFHPYRENNKLTNRSPNAAELNKGFEILNELLALFPIKKILAVGRKSELMLKKTNFDFAYLRHPSYGGKSDFVRGLKQVNK